MKTTGLGLAILLAVDLLAVLPTMAESDRQSFSPGDPAVESAFAVPQGINYSQEQRKAYNELRERRISELCQALNAVKAATDDIDKDRATATVLRIRGEIRAEIAAIVRAGQIKAMREAQAKWQEAMAKKRQAEAKRRQAQKKKGGKKRGGKKKKRR